MGSSEGKAVTSKTSHTLTETCENDCFFFSFCKAFFKVLLHSESNEM